MKPFLRWAGGKNWLVKEINQILNPEDFNNYHELFLGGGSMFFHLRNYFENDVFLSDLNQNLINTYIQIRDNVESVIEQLKMFENTKEFYYYLRSQIFEDPILRAAQFIFLNQTSFNGIYRVNLQGIYNVPYGYRKKDFINEKVLRTASFILQGVHISFGEFDQNIDQIQNGDLVFLDPPYTITHNNNGFIKYNEHLFSEGDQHRLANFIRNIDERGAFYVLTNAAHHDIQQIFNLVQPIVLHRNSLVGGKNANRGNYEEYLFTNIQNEFLTENRIN